MRRAKGGLELYIKIPTGMFPIFRIWKGIFFLVGECPRWVAERDRLCEMLDQQ